MCEIVVDSDLGPRGDGLSERGRVGYAGASGSALPGSSTAGIGSGAKVPLSRRRDRKSLRFSTPLARRSAIIAATTRSTVRIARRYLKWPGNGTASGITIGRLKREAISMMRSFSA